VLASGAMRTLDRRPRGPGLWVSTSLILTACLVVACGSGSPSLAVVTPAPTPTPSPTPDPHLIAPAKADDVYLGLRAAGLVITPNTANTGGAGHDPVKEIEATYDGWPLSIGQYRSAVTLDTATNWQPGAQPGVNEAPIEFIGLNILVRWGPISNGPTPRIPDGPQLASAEKLRAALDRLLSPLTPRTIVTLPGAGTPPPASPAPSVKPTPKPTAKPKVTAKPKATR
jgi:hypothetical protein